MKRAALVFLSILPLAITVEAGQTARSALTVVSSAPQGEIASLAEANEIRIVFSEPMVALGRIPSVVRAPFFRISPTVNGTFRWSGTTILIFTPDPRRPLPFATTYEITIDASATATSGRKLVRPLTFRFTTPTVKLLETKWYRRDGKVTNSIVLLMRFNQPVRPADVAPHVTAALQPHDWVTPVFTPEEQARLRTIDAQALDRFNAKVSATRAIAAATSPVDLRLTADWDRKAHPPGRDLVVFETTSAVKPESWVRLSVDGAVPSPAGSATPGKEQTFTVQAEPAFFIDGFDCHAECEPDRWNPVKLRNDVSVKAFAAATRATDLTARPAAVAKQPVPPSRGEGAIEEARNFTLEDAGFGPQPPVTK